MQTDIVKQIFQNFQASIGYIENVHNPTVYGYTSEALDVCVRKAALAIASASTLITLAENMPDGSFVRSGSLLLRGNDGGHHSLSLKQLKDELENIRNIFGKSAHAFDEAHFLESENNNEYPDHLTYEGYRDCEKEYEAAADIYATLHAQTLEQEIRLDRVLG